MLLLLDFSLIFVWTLGEKNDGDDFIKMCNRSVLRQLYFKLMVTEHGNCMITIQGGSVMIQSSSSHLSLNNELIQI